jgi:TetR/AcrR family transcriptional regulator
MGRRVDKERHADLARRAFESVRKNGVQNVTMSQIAAELGLSRSNLYWYFSSLRDIFDALLSDLIIEQYTFVGTRLKGVDHPLDLLGSWMDAVLEFYRRDPDLLAALVHFWTAGGPGGPDEVVTKLLERFKPLRAMAIDAVSRGVAEGRVASCDPEALVDLCAVTVDGALIHSYSRGLDTAPLLETFRNSVLSPLRLGP